MKFTHIHVLFFFVLMGLMACNSAQKGKPADVQKQADKEKTTVVQKADNKAGGLQFMKVGDAAPMVATKMTDISGKELSIEDVKGENGTLVMFSCNTCPYVIGWEDRYLEVSKLCKENNIGMITINSNEAKREGDDSLEKMKEHASEKSYDFAYVVDPNSAIADAFGATRTPDVFLFDKDMKLAYQGAIDDNMKEPEKVEEPYLKNAISNLASGKPIDPRKTKSIGCTIKRIKKL